MGSQQIGIAFLTLAGLALGGGEIGSLGPHPEPRTFYSIAVPSNTRRPPFSVRTKMVYSKSAA